MIQPVTPELAKAFDLKDASGALVGQVTEGSPAEKGGLKEGDVVTEFNGKKVTDSRQFRLMVAQAAPNTEVKLEVIRDGKTRSVTVKLGELPKEGLARAGGLQRAQVASMLGRRDRGRSRSARSAPSSTFGQPKARWSH